MPPDFFFFFSWCYNPWWVLACFMILFHYFLSLHFCLQFLTFIFFKSSTCSSHLSLGLPTGLDEHGSHPVSFLTLSRWDLNALCSGCLLEFFLGVFKFQCMLLEKKSYIIDFSFKFNAIKFGNLLMNLFIRKKCSSITINLGLWIACIMENVV